MVPPNSAATSLSPPATLTKVEDLALLQNFSGTAWLPKEAH
jgi:hypothetical protein